MNVSSWWGRHSIEPNRTDFWELGPLKVWLQSLPHQWRITWKSSGNWLDSRVRIVPGSSGEKPPDDSQRVNCAFGAHPRQDIIFAPALPDRALVSRLETPLHILPNETLSLYVLSPLNLKMEMADAHKLIHEIPTYRMSDTWFGPMSPDGELCYASTVPAYLDLQEVPLRLHCAISAVQVRNLGADPLFVDRIKVPLTRLSLFYSPRTGFWTDAFTLERREGQEMAELRLNRQAPPEASPSQIVSGPRNPAIESVNPVVRSFGALFKDRSHL